MNAMVTPSPQANSIRPGGTRVAEIFAVSRHSQVRSEATAAERRKKRVIKQEIHNQLLAEIARFMEPAGAD